MFFGPSLLLQLFKVTYIAMSTLSSQKVAVVGGGSVGSALANGLAQSKADNKPASVVIAARNPEKTKAALAEKKLDHLTVKANKEAIAEADILILAVPGAHTDEGIYEMAKSLGDVSGKVIIDATNPLTEFSDGLQVRWTQGTSGGEILQKALPNSKVYKAFNTLGVEHMVDANGKQMMYAGPDNDIEALIAAIGYVPYHVGPIRYARNLEAIAELWIHMAIPPLPATQIGRDWTFAIVGNPEK